MSVTGRGGRLHSPEKENALKSLVSRLVLGLWSAAMRFALVIAFSVALAAPALAQTCEGDLTGRDDNCTAGDVQIATLQVLPGGVIDPCDFVGDTAIVNL